MKTLIAFVVATALSLSITGLVSAHGPARDETGGSPMMFRMMELMHGNLEWES